jgi:hypothetical protein
VCNDRTAKAWKVTSHPREDEETRETEERIFPSLNECSDHEIDPTSAQDSQDVQCLRTFKVSHANTNT